MKVLLFLLASILAVGMAQTKSAPPFTSVPVMEDRGLYYSFFNYHHGLIVAMNAAVKASPQAAAQLSQQMAAQLGVTPAELTLLNDNTEQMNQACAAVLAERDKNRSIPPKAGQPTWALMEGQYDLKLSHITFDAIRYLSQTLSTASWKGLHGYIMGDYKKNVRKGQ